MWIHLATEKKLSTYIWVSYTYVIINGQMIEAAIIIGSPTFIINFRKKTNGHITSGDRTNNCMSMLKYHECKKH